MVLDRLGGVKLRSNDLVSPTIFQYSNYYPFGEERTAKGQGRTKFATYYRDNKTSFDYAMNRYYNNSWGRFLTPDPYGPSAKPANPLSWNRYAYVANDPVNRNDPSGLNMMDFWDPGWGGGGGGGFDAFNPGSPCDAYAGCGWDAWNNWGNNRGNNNGNGPDPGEPSDPRGGAGGENSRISVRDYSRAGPKESTIATVLQKLLDSILSQNNDCSKWLSGAEFSGAEFVRAILAGGPSDYTFGHGILSSSSTAAFVGNRNPDGTPVQGLPIDSSITVNDNGGFFTPGFTIGPRNYQGGRLQAQASILLHEIAHEVGAAGIKSDAGKPAAGQFNDSLVDKYCGKEIRGLK